MIDVKPPQVAVLLTGDGRGSDDGVGFHADLERMHASGWGIEVVSWDRACARKLRDWATTTGVFVRLEDHYESVTFLEGGLRASKAAKATRATAKPRA